MKGWPLSPFRMLRTLKRVNKSIFSLKKKKKKKKIFTKTGSTDLKNKIEKSHSELRNVTHVTVLVALRTFDSQKQADPFQNLVAQYTRLTVVHWFSHLPWSHCH